MLKEENAELLIGGQRVESDYTFTAVLINGNQTCLLFLYYIIKNRIAMGKMKDCLLYTSRCV